MEDKEGNIWIANERDGLFIYYPATGQIEQFVHESNNTKSLSYSRTIQSYQDPHGRIWIGSRNVIELWDPATRSFKHYPNEEFKDAIYARPLGSDLKGRLWVSYDGTALGILDPATGIFSNFGYSSGLCGPSDMKLLEDGRVILVGARGMNIVNPESLFTPLQPPQLFFTRMTINDTIQISPQRLSLESRIQLSYKQNVIEFEFVAIKPGEASLIEYNYKLDGLEETWINPKDRRFVRYPGLSPGDYLFRVKAISTRNEWQPKEIALAITIFPPWWQTWWACTLYALSFIGLLYSGYRLRLRQVQLKQQVEIEHFQTEHLAEVDRLKSRFFSNISHEFRTPLTLILGPAEQMMDQSEDTTARQKLYLIKDNAKKLLGLVNQLLDFSRLESGVMKLQVSSGDIVRFLRRVVMSFESWAEKKKIMLEFKSEIEANEGLFDSDMLEKIMNNLMSNALKFTKEGGSVVVSVGFDPTLGGQKGSSEGTVVISVSDTGPGISPEHLPHIFDRFYRVDDTHTTEGTGIGLALVKELVQLHHGTITAESEQGKGSVFTLTLPIEKSSYAEEEIGISPPQYEEHESYEFTVYSEEIKPTTVTKVNEGKPIILIVEDNADLRKYICEFLDKDYAIRESGDGEMGYNAAMEIIPDLVISDIMMPKMDGIKLCRTIKQDVRTSHVPVILLTARAGTDSKIEGLETGADDYITKPFDVRELSARVKNLIEQRRQLRQKFSAGTVLKPGDVAVTSLDDDLLKRVIVAVEKNIGNEDFDVDSLAQEACLSRPHLNRKLRALTDLSPAEFIRYIRLQRARELLEKNAGNIADVAYQVGFGSPAYFSSCFHQRFGYSPSEVHTRNREM
jgi:signal transduction histidine kinase/DNA-binding response OmpR family regulator